MAFDVTAEEELEVARKIFWLLTQDHIFLGCYNEDKNTWDDGAYPAINCNDLFVPAADYENLTKEDLDLYVDVVKKFPRAGSAAWCAVKRSENLWDNPFKRDDEWIKEYHEANDYISNTLKTFINIIKVKEENDMGKKDSFEEEYGKTKWQEAAKQAVDQPLHFLMTSAPIWVSEYFLHVPWWGWLAIPLVILREYKQWPSSRWWDPYLDWVFLTLGVIVPTWVCPISNWF